MSDITARDAPDQMLRLREVKNLTGVSSSTIYRWIDKNGFPSPIKLGAAAARWRATDLQAWIERRAAEAR